jgi:retinol dehydrogenase-12
MNGKTVLVTGGTSGIGRVTAQALKDKGARVVVIGRDPQKLAQMNGFETIQADLSLVSEAKRAAREFRERFGKVDVLVNNAGAVFGDYKETREGHERTFALNHLGYFAITMQLLDLLRESHGRVVSVSSDAHKGAKLHFDDLEMKQGFSGMRQYCNTKLMNLLFSSELARREPSITSNAVHPGLVASGFGKSDAGFTGFLTRIARPFMISAEKGAQTSIWAASDPSLEKVTGQYFIKKKSRKPTSAARSPDAARRLWEISERMSS